MKAIYRFFISLWTLEGLIVLTIAICLTGSLMLPSNLAFFSGIDDTPLFDWLAEAGEPGTTWWIYALIGAMTLLATSTLVCTVDALVKAAGRADFMLRLFPQVMHIGVLLVLLGYLLTSWMGTKEDVLLKQGQTGQIGNNISMTLKSVGSDTDTSGYYEGWEALLVFEKDGETLSESTLRPVKPLKAAGATLFFKSITLPPKDSDELPSALIRVSRDPGVIWALSGGLLIVIGGIGFLVTRGRKRSA